MKRLRITMLFFCINNAVAQQHPYLYFTNEKVDKLREQLKSDKSINKAYSEIESIARQCIEEANPYSKIEYMALVYQVSGDKNI